jgi:hypothetical protein
MPLPGGCLTKKNTQECLAILTRSLTVFFDFFHFLLLFILFVTFVTYFLLLKEVRFVTFCYFFIACNFDKSLFTIEKGQGLYFIHCATRELEKVQLDFFFFFFFLLLRGKGVEVNVLFSVHWKCGKRRGERVNFFVRMFFSWSSD